MDHLAGVILFGILLLAVLRIGTGLIVGLIVGRRRPPDRTRLGHAVAGVVGAVLIPVAAETVIGAPVTLISQLVTGWQAVAEMLAYVIGFSAIGAVVVVYLYRNLRFAPSASEQRRHRDDDDGAAAPLE